MWHHLYVPVHVSYFVTPPICTGTCELFCDATYMYATCELFCDATYMYMCELL
jgi:hypothetical protein